MKKLAALLTAITLVATTVFAAPVKYGAELTNQPTKSYSQMFNDVPKSYWAFSYIGEMVTRGVLSGYPDGNFYPDNNITRAEFAKIMTCAAGLTIDENAGTIYDDVIWDDWSVPYIEAAKYYLSGYYVGDYIYYFPDDLALREDIAVALVKLKGYSTTGYDLSILQTMFTDWQSISDGARKYVSVAVEQGLISGYDDRTFRGQDGITRAEAATLLWRAYQYGNGNKNFELVPEDVKVPETKKEEPVKEENKEEVKKPAKETPKDEPKEDTKTETKREEKQEEPKKDYTWNLKTIKASGLGNVDIFQAVPGGVSYKDGQRIYKVSDNGGQSVIYDADDQLYLGDDEISSRDDTSYTLWTYGYNYYDDCYYVLIYDHHDSLYRLRNITNGDTITLDCDGIGCASTNNGIKDYPIYASDIQFTKNGEKFFICPNATIYSSGQTKCTNYGTDFLVSAQYKNEFYLYNINDCRLQSQTSVIEKDKFITVCCIPIPLDGKFYGWDDGSIFALDTDGNVKTFANLSMDNVQNDEERDDLNFDEVFAHGSMNENHDIYFFDTRYGAVRVLEYLK